MSNKADQARDGKTRVGGSAGTEVVTSGARRRLIKGGLSATAPVILTLTSRPVLGFQQACLAPSRMISGNHSGLVDSTVCDGKSREFWYREAKEVVAGQWKSSLPWADLDFALELAIPAAAYVSTKSPGKKNWKVGDVLIDSFEGGDSRTVKGNGLASYIIAAYQNVSTVSSVSEVLTLRQCITMWNDLILPPGQYCPQGGTKLCWDALGVVGYLENSGIVPS